MTYSVPPSVSLTSLTLSRALTSTQLCCFLYVSSAKRLPDSPPTEMHGAFLRLHLFPTAILRKSFRGEHGWGTQYGQMRALSQRLRRACSESEWPALWREALAAHHSRHHWHLRHLNPRSKRTQAAQRLGRAMRLASEAQYGRATRALTNALMADPNNPITHAALSTLHPKSPAPVRPIPSPDLPPTPDIA